MHSVRNSDISPQDIFNRFSQEMFNAKSNESFFIKTLPNEDDFKRSSKGEMLKIWPFLVKHCFSTETFERIRGNLKMKNILKDQSALASRKQKVSTIKSELEHLSEELMNKQKKKCYLMTEKKKLYEETIRADNDVRMKREMHEKMQQELFLLQYYFNSMREKKLKCAYFDDKLSHYNRTFFSNSPNKDEPRFDNEKNHLPAETVDKEEIGEAINSIENYLKEIYSSNEESDQKQIQLEQFCNLIKTSFSLHTPHIVLQMVNNHQKESLNSLHNVTEEVDIKRDAENLRFDYVKTEISDVSNQANILQTIHETLNDRQLSQIEQSFQILQHRNKIFHTQAKLSTTWTNLTLYLDKNFENDKKLMEITRQFVQTSIDLVGIQAAMDFLMNKKKDLHSQMQKQMHLQQLTEMKLIKIRTFNRLKDSKLSNIQSLMRKNINIHNRLTQYKKQILNFLENVINKECKELMNSLLSLRNSVPLEIRTLQKWPMHTLFSISSLHSSSFPIQSILESTEDFVHVLFTDYNIPVFKNIEVLLFLLIQMKTDKMKVFPKHSSSCSILWEDRTTFTEDSNALLARVREHDSQQMELLLPLLKKIISSSKKNLSICESTKKLIDYWWTYPALSIPTKITCVSLSLDKWKQRWSEALA